jgi:four helix bundle protein
MQDFRKLEVWQDAKDLAKEIYTMTKNFPEDEKYGVISQLRRAGASVGANIAEGCGRHTNKDFLKFLYISSGSLKECLHFLILCNELGYVNTLEFARINENLDKTARKLNNFIKRLCVTERQTRNA